MSRLAATALRRGAVLIGLAAASLALSTGPSPAQLPTAEQPFNRVTLHQGPGLTGASKSWDLPADQLFLAVPYAGETFAGPSPTVQVGARAGRRAVPVALLHLGRRHLRLCARQRRGATALVDIGQGARPAGTAVDRAFRSRLGGPDRRLADHLSPPRRGRRRAYSCWSSGATSIGAAAARPRRGATSGSSSRPPRRRTGAPASTSTPRSGSAPASRSSSTSRPPAFSC